MIVEYYHDLVHRKELPMARVVRFHEIGGPEVLRIENVEIPPPGKGEVQIRIHALGLNRAEVMF
jgi:NADPH:quinone reductase-like Zn-dependent oxidoreductase